MHQIILDNFLNLDVTTFDAKLEKLQTCLNCQVLKELLPFISLMHGFDKKRGH